MRMGPDDYFIKVIENNIKGIENQPCFEIMIMRYDSIVIKK